MTEPMDRDALIAAINEAAPALLHSCQAVGNIERQVAIRVAEFARKAARMLKADGPVVDAVGCWFQKHGMPPSIENLEEAYREWLTAQDTEGSG